MIGLYAFPAAHLVGALLAVIGGWIVWQRIPIAGASSYVGLTLALVIWQLCVTFAQVSSDPGTGVGWSKAHYLGVEAVPVFWLLFAARYTGQDGWLTRGRIAALWLVPVLTLVVIATNESHGWYWPSVAYSDAAGLRVYAHGPWFWINAVYLHALDVTGMVLIARAAAHAVGRLRTQYRLLLAISLLPLFVNGIFLLTGVEMAKNLTPTTLTVAAVLTGVRILRFRHRGGGLPGLSIPGNGSLPGSPVSG